MKRVFADTVYWIARVRADDAWAEAAAEARRLLGDVWLFTTDEVLSELLTSLSKYGEHLRTRAANAVREILQNPNVRVIPQTRDSFLKGLALYQERPDKTYSLTDCISMNAMRAEGVTEVLTNDGHFTQDGFTVLMTRK